MTTLDVFVPGHARTKGSWRPVVRGRKVAFLPQTDEKPWALAVAWAARAARPRLIAKPKACAVELRFAFRRPKKPANEFPLGDADKLARSVLDALTGICWDDDAQVSDLYVTKCYGDDEGVRVVVREMT
jgi:crossover junction endodeoxyribonuclease RusA